MTKNLSSIPIQPYSTSQAFQEALSAIPCMGVLCQETTGYLYLKVSQDFIDKLLPLIKLRSTQRLVIDRPENDVGAHISIVYPDEIQTGAIVPNLGRTIDFTVQDLSLYTASVHGKSHMVLVVQSRALEALRIALHLQKEHFYCGVQVPFHITLSRVVDGDV